MRIQFDHTINDFLLFCKENYIDIYLVGGAIRDFLLDKECFDLDFCLTSDYDEAYKLLNSRYKCKKDDKYQAIKFELEKYTIEISHARKENEYLDYRHPYVIEFTNDIREDSKRRDFTINAIYYRDGKVYDFYNGVNDLENKKLKVIGDTLTRFKEDPLRILRMIRFSCLGFDIDESDRRIILDHGYLLKELSITSFNKEFDKILKINNLYVINEYKPLFEEYFEIKINDISSLNKLVSLDEKKTYLGIKNKSNIYKYRNIIICDDRKELTKVIYKLDKDIVKELVEYYDRVNCKNMINLYNDIISNDFYSKNQLDITSEDIIKLINKKELTSYYIDMISYAIIDNRLVNKKEKIIKYILENR